MTQISRSEAIDMLTNSPLIDVLSAGFKEKNSRFGGSITYANNLQINPTNLCIYSCRFCDFAAKPNSQHAYMLDSSEILNSISKLADVDEVHIVGGLWPKWGFSQALELVTNIRSRHPRIWIKAFTAVEMAYFAHQERKPVSEVIHHLRAAGLNAMPGGGAEVLNTRIHRELFPDKIGPKTWLEIHATAHDMGLPTNASLLFGHIETPEEIVDHLLLLRNSQEEAPGFVSFIPLAYRVGRSSVVSTMASPQFCLRVIAVSRLLLDNIPHIKAYWPSIGIETAVLGMSSGADDLEGTIGAERIMHFAGADTPTQLRPEDCQRLIKSAGQTPRRRFGDFSISIYH